MRRGEQHYRFANFFKYDCTINILHLRFLQSYSSFNNGLFELNILNNSFSLSLVFIILFIY